MPWPNGRPAHNTKFPSDAQFMAEFAKMGALALAKKYDTAERNVYKKRKQIEERQGAVITAPMSVVVAEAISAPLWAKSCLTTF